MSTTPASPPPTREGRFAPLDGLRGVAIAMVLWYHLVDLNLPPGRGTWLGWLRAGTGLSWSGVDLFFTLSGFLIGGILIDNRDSGNLTRAFYLRRAARILPLYFLTLSLIFLCIALRLPGSFHRFPSWVYCLFLTNVAVGAANVWDWGALSVMWSLAVEEQFYLCAPWIIRKVRKDSVPILAMALAAAAEFLRVGVRARFPSSALLIQTVTPFRMDSLALGMLGAWVARSSPAAWPRLWLARHWRVALAACFAAFLVLAALRPAEGSMLRAAAGYATVSVFFGVLVMVVSIEKPPIICQLLSVGWLTTLGKQSYFIYLWHMLVAPPLIRWLAGPDFMLDSIMGVAVVVGAAAVIWAAAWASRKWFEGPIIRWSHRFSY